MIDVTVAPFKVFYAQFEELSGQKKDVAVRVYAFLNITAAIYIIADGFVDVFMLYLAIASIYWVYDNRQFQSCVES